jgi:hypothetical protein
MPLERALGNPKNFGGFFLCEEYHGGYIGRAARMMQFIPNFPDIFPAQ